MVPIAIGQASTVRVGFHRGAGQPLLARHSGFIALALALAFMAATTLVLEIEAGSIIHLYIGADDPERDQITRIGRTLIQLAALFQLFDGTQVVCAGNLRGLKDTRVTLLAAIVGYWGIGLSLGVYLAFAQGWGPAGLWWCIVVGLAVVAVALCWRFNRLSARLAAA